MSMTSLSSKQMVHVVGGQDENTFDAVGCSLAIAGTLATTAGAVFITGGAAAPLIVWGVGKAIATASVAYGCS